MTAGQTMRYIVLPQAIKNILPAIGNEFVVMVKETAILQYLGVSDLMYNGQHRPDQHLQRPALLLYLRADLSGAEHYPKPRGEHL